MKKIFKSLLHKPSKMKGFFIGRKWKKYNIRFKKNGIC